MAYNKMTIAVRECFQAAGRITPNMLGARWANRWQGSNGVIARLHNIDMRVDANTVYQGGAPILTKVEAHNFAVVIDNLNNGANHLNVKYNATWMTAYQLAQRDMDFMDATGATATVQVETMPCHNCGIVLPLDCIQVDHYMPQAGSEDTYTLKMLRVLGLTVAGPTGSKGTALHAGVPLGLIHPKARARGDYDHLANATPGAKWTTNDKGAALLTVLQLKNAIPDLQRACKNSTLNLAPLCGECNREKSDYVRPIV